MMTYREQVQVYSDDGETLIGAGTFNGTARRSTRGGLWSWRGRVTNMDVDPGDVAGKAVRLKFSDGATGQAVCLKCLQNTRGGFILELKGDGIPPRVEAG